MAQLHPVLAATLALWRKSPDLRLPETPCGRTIRRILINGRATLDDLHECRRVLDVHAERLSQLGIRIDVLPPPSGDTIHFNPHPSSIDCILQEGLYSGQNLGALAVSNRAYLERVARTWPGDPLVADGALQALLGLEVNRWPADWKVQVAVGGGGDNPFEYADPPPVSNHDLNSSLAEAEEARSAVLIRHVGESLHLSFPFNPDLQSIVRGLRGRWNSDDRAWVLPQESAVELVEHPEFLEGNEVVLLPLAERFRSVVANRREACERLIQRGYGTVSEIMAAGVESFVARSRKSPGKVAAIYPFDESINEMLVKQVNGHFNKQAGARLFEEADLPVVYTALRNLGFVFETDLYEAIRQDLAKIKASSEEALAHDHPLRGAKDADLDYVAANGWSPRPYQKADIVYGIDCLQKRGGVGLFLEMRLGKALSDDMRVLTPTGWKRNGDLAVGDLVIGSDGHPTKIQGVYPQGEIDTYRVVFSDGSSVECSADHLWAVNTPVRRWRGMPDRVLTLAEILAEGLTDAAGNRRHFIPMVSPVEFDEGELPLDPYLLASLLGDGGMTAPLAVSFSTRDVEMVEALATLLPNGLEMRPRGPDWCIARPKDQVWASGERRSNEVVSALTDLGLHGCDSATKFIPHAYKFSSVQTRIALLQGLMDTDGSVRPKDNHLELATVSPRLAEDVRFIVESLGGTCRIRQKKTSYSYRGEKRQGKNAYVLSIALPEGIQPFRLSRKAEVYRPRAKFPPSRSIKAVEPLGKKSCTCISVEADDSLYVTEHMIVTHNTFITASIYDILRRERPDLRLLVIAPRSAFTAWRKEVTNVLGGEMFYSRIKRGEHGLNAMLERLEQPADKRPVIGVVVSGDKKARETALGALPEVIVCNYDSMRNSEEAIAKWITSGGPVLMIADESHRLKNPDSKTFKAVMKMISLPQVQKENGGGRIALTGTPIPQGPWEFYAQACFLDGGIQRCRFGKSFRLFRERFFHIDRGPEGKWFIPKGFKNKPRKDEFKKHIEVGTVWRNNRDISKATKNLEISECEFATGPVRKMYDLLAELRKQEISEMSDEEIRSLDPALLFLRQRQLISHPLNLINSWKEALRSQEEVAKRIADAEAMGKKLSPKETRVENEDLLVLPQDLMQDLEEWVRGGGTPEKMELLQDLLEDILAADENAFSKDDEEELRPVEKVVIGCDFAATEEALYEALKKYKPLRYHAGLNDMERARVQDMFQEDREHRILIANSLTIREGLKLTAARTIILYDPACGYSNTTWKQVQDRVVDVDVANTVTVLHLIVSGSCDVHGLTKTLSRDAEASDLLESAIQPLPASVRDLLKKGGDFRSKQDLLKFIDGTTSKAA